jgi:hypothetical protein
MIKIKANIEDNASPALRAVIGALTGAKAESFNALGGRAAVIAAKAYHRDFDKAKGWRGARYLGPSQGDGGSFGAAITAGWNFQSSDQSGATIVNSAQFYAHKVTGGTITPKRAKWLTIPLIAEAKGLRVFSYQEITGKRLFRPKGKNVLMEKTADGGIRSVYALVRSVTHKPTPGALPDKSLLADAFVKRWREALATYVDGL